MIPSHLKLSSDSVYYRRIYNLEQAIIMCEAKIVEVQRAIKKGRGAMKYRLKQERLRLRTLQAIREQRHLRSAIDPICRPDDAARVFIAIDPAHGEDRSVSVTALVDGSGIKIISVDEEQ